MCAMGRALDPRGAGFAAVQVGVRPSGEGAARGLRAGRHGEMGEWHAETRVCHYWSMSKVVGREICWQDSQ
jgi:hypothetical protein